jgi:branched-subunit amino acid aminotransferase/4-amino-4-deoxychorismate lyase
MGCDEAFIVNSLVEVMPIREIDDHLLGDEGKVGPVTKKLLDTYRERIKSESKK